MLYAVLFRLLIFNSILLRIYFVVAFQQLQLFQNKTEADIFKSVFTSHIGRFKILSLPKLCTFKKLDECHENGYQHFVYYEACFKERCTRDDYYCINGNDYTLHICGAMPICMLRYRNVVIYDRAGSDYVDVYSVLCPDGYLQFSSGNCFNTCYKDNSVVVIQNSTRQKHAFGYCNTEQNKCNQKGLTVFEIASEDDQCSTEDSKCQEIGDLLPDCTCSPTCRLGEVRSFSSNFICEARHKRITASAHPSIFTEITSQNPSQRPHITTSGNHTLAKDYGLTIIITVSVTVTVIVVLLALMILIYKVWYRDQTENRSGHTENGVLSGYRGVPDMDLAETGSERTGNGVPSEFTENGSVHTANGSLSEQVRKLMNKTEINRKTYKIKAENVYIQDSNGSPNRVSEEIDRMIDEQNDEQRMDNLKLANETQPDNDISSNEQTSVMKPYSS